MKLQTKQNIRSLGIDKLIFDLKDIAAPYRVRQIQEWLWKKLTTNFELMSNLPKELQKYLNEHYYIDNLHILKKEVSKDGTMKILFQTIDDMVFESVLIPSINRRATACISTQIGCALNCSFCATAKLGFKRNLSIGELYEQVFIINEMSISNLGYGLTNIVLMGMGEPLLNYENVKSFIQILCSEQGLNVSSQRITLSTSGITYEIKRLADDNLGVNLSISLHSADNNKRSKIMPINNNHNLDKLKEAIIYYYEKTNQRITYEYLLLKNINDSLEDAKLLTDFTKISPCKINIINYNMSELSDYKTSDKENIKAFENFIKKKNMIVTIRQSRGSDISAACGQLANKKNNCIFN